VLFVTLAALAGLGVVLEHPTIKTLVLLALCVWAAARAYYFLFYVIQHYIDPDYRYSGLISLVRRAVQRRGQDRV
jgi:hypothetical protein